MKAILMALVTGCLIVALTSAQSRSASNQYQEALRLEEIKGDLKGAIELYRKLAQDTDRAIAAKALVQMAGCYEKLGQIDARQAYERVAKEFADQIEPVAYARVRLASLGATSMASAANVPVKSRILADLGRTVQSVSLDGRYAIVGDAADLVILDLRTGNRRRVRQGNARTREAPEGESAWSRDGKQVAFNWEYREPSYRTELRLVAFNGSGDRLLYRKDEIDHIDVVDWTPDGKSILVGLEHVSTNAEDIAFISATDGSVRVLKTMDTGLDNLALSPDGSWIAYSAPRRINEPRDVFVIAADGTREAQIVQNPADDLVLAWAPDGRSVLFSSNRSGSTEVWSVPIRDGRPTGYPQFLRLGLGDVAFRGSTPGGRLYYGVNAGAARDTYIGRLDPATGNVAGPLEPVPTRHATRNGAAAWSPNGRQLASWTNAPSQAIAIFSVDTAQEREIRPRNLGIDHPIRWTPDGSALLFTARVLDAAEASPRVITRNLYRLQVETEEVRLLVPAVPGGTIHAGDLSPDGRTLYTSSTPSRSAHETSRRVKSACFTRLPQGTSSPV